MRLVTVYRYSFGPWKYCWECNSLAIEDRYQIVKEWYGEQWTHVTVESAREDYGVVVPARTAGGAP